MRIPNRMLVAARSMNHNSFTKASSKSSSLAVAAIASFALPRWPNRAIARMRRTSFSTLAAGREFPPNPWRPLRHMSSLATLVAKSSTCLRYALGLGTPAKPTRSLNFIGALSKGIRTKARDIALVAANLAEATVASNS
jgi:hypothetical protein